MYFFPVFLFFVLNSIDIEFEAEGKNGREVFEFVLHNTFPFKLGILGVCRFLGSNVCREPYHGVFTGMPRILKQSAITPQ